MPLITLAASPLLRLPDELLAAIGECFRAMDSSTAATEALACLAGVNRRLLSIVVPILWRSHVFSKGPGKRAKTTETLRKYGEHIKDLTVVLRSVASQFGSEFEAVAEWLPFCSNVETFTLETYTITHSRRGLWRHEGGQEDGDVEATIGPASLGAGLRPLADLGAQLRSLDIGVTFDSKILADDVTLLLSVAPNLRRLSLLPTDFDVPLAENDSVPVIPAMPLLKTLEIESGNFLRADAAICLPGLEDLDVGYLDPDGLSRGRTHLFTSLRCLTLQTFDMPRRFFSSFIDPKTPIEAVYLFALSGDTFDDLQDFVKSQPRQTISKITVESSEDPQVDRERVKECFEWAAGRGIEVDALWPKPIAYRRTLVISPPV
ncbi:hypothetical protein BMF94_4753 [Rhodotorula taiwanensis]|uniref:F-box domain-containing protein n=1 Tax=Rhodotorula taiwanensis TaxID=741276 RepID=A0A2S5B648_9BASI|nr:hypothetical protein BMF94_4753 [Rhodotorula taiwanensis]